MSSRVLVVGVGVQTALGRTPLAAAAAVRGHLSAAALHPYLVDRLGQPVRVAAAPWLAVELPLVERLLALGGDAATEALAPGVEVLARLGIGVHLTLGLPALRPGLPARSEDVLLEAIRQRVSAQLPVLSASTRRLGHVSGLSAIEAGARSIREGTAQACLVGGVESYIDRETLEWIDWTGQLLAHKNPRGFVPGEAAAFCLLVSEELGARRGLPALAEIRGAATALEPKLRRDRAVCVGEGLTAAFRAALATLPEKEERVDQLIYDLNGQPHRAEEYGFTAMRLGHRLRDPGNFLTPADCWGDVGAASGPLFVMLGIIGYQKRYLAGPNVLVWASAMLAERSAVLVQVSQS